MVELLQGEVHIWVAQLSFSGVLRGHSCLSITELDRASRFHFLKDRETFLAAHLALRDILSRYADCSPGDLCFTVDSFGKPSLSRTGKDAAPEFNLSHSGALAVVAIFAGSSVGVDVEEIRSVSDFSSIAEAYFTPEECAFIFQHPPADREQAFLRCWTRKEAFIKAVGKGLSMTLDSFSTLIPAGQPALKLGSCADAPDVATWSLKDIHLPTGYVGAVAADSEIGSLRYIAWQPDLEV